MNNLGAARCFGKRRELKKFERLRCTASPNFLITICYRYDFSLMYITFYLFVFFSYRPPMSDGQVARSRNLEQCRAYYRGIGMTIPAAITPAAAWVGSRYLP